MAVLHPFKAWRPVPAKVKEIACVPYDVVSTAEAREKAEGNPHSFLHVVRPEIDLPEGTPYNDDRVYEKGAANLRELLRSDLMEQEPEPAIYIYRLTTEDRSQTGVFSCVSVEDYDSGVILKHELTRPDKEDDRTRHILEQSAHAEPVMLAFDDQVDLSAMMENITANENPIYDYEAEDGIRHSLWKAPENIRFIDRFAALGRLYIADGHHRCKSASRAAEVLRTEDPGHTGKEEYNFFPAVIFPKDQMEILPYNRVIHEVPEDVIDQLNRDFDLEEPVDPKPEHKGRIALYYGGRWFGLSLPLADDPNAVEQLDVHRLQHFILEPLLGISDPRTDDNISFVGGIRGTGRLEELVDSEKADLAVSMYPTSIEELMEVSDRGRLMPPKSTWFEPKLRSGLLIHTFESK